MLMKCKCQNARQTPGLLHLPHDPARQGISTSNLDLSTSLTPILQLSPIASVDTRSGKRLYRKRTVVNVAFTGSIPGIVISTGNAK